MSTTTIYNFQKNSNPKDWQIVNDGVMGGLSQGHFKMNDLGNGVFYGAVSTENDGGFSSVKYSFDAIQVEGYRTIRLTLKGDGKDYQFRIKDKVATSHSYITSFSTNGDWQEVEILLQDLFPFFRGRKMNLPNFDKSSFEEIRFLIGNKKDESFELMIDKIELQ